jgi:hypothetical protein
MSQFLLQTFIIAWVFATPACMGAARSSSCGTPTVVEEEEGVGSDLAIAVDQRMHWIL